MMKVAIIFAFVVASSWAAPQNLVPNERNSIPTVRDNRSDDGDGSFAYDFETGNGIVVAAAGTPGEEGATNIEGSYRFPMGDGRFLEVSYVADERGFRPSTKIVDV